MRIFLLLLLILIILPVGGVSAQAPVEFSSFSIDLWPEYDRPEVLVIYRGVLSSSAALPAEVSLRIPATAGQPYNVAYQEIDGQLYNLAYDVETEGEWLRVTFTLPAQTLHLEYYDPGLTRSGSQRTFQYRWPGDYPVQNISLRAQQPVNAEEVLFVPDMGLPTMSSDGLVYFSKEIGQVSRGTEFSLQMEYTKPDDVLTSAGLQPVEPSGSIPSAGQSGLLTGAGALFLGAAGLLLVGAGVAWLFIRQRREPAAASRRRHHRRQVEQAADGEPPAGAVYCQRCGKRAAAGDAFCRACGTRLRSGGAS